MAVPGAENRRAPGLKDQRRFSWYQFLFGPTFAVIGFFYRSYRSNRDRLAKLMSSTWASSLFSKAVVLTLIAWIAIWLLASEENRNRLTEAVKQNLAGLQSSFRN